ncbi:two-component system response regulator [Alteromonas gilva]|uniref:EAL domain-containing protein n=1 Tax=Alteromonas gilva TaxID=2987522 RepID=A0ABT5L174_9ALTE|nr:EAL domain-containing protein [Alteromonas gilva]MDC8830774.1 EAL domain-containing protein [Alteromonas gilva]
MKLDFNKGLILAVDDQAADLLIVEHALSDYYTVVTTTSPEKALSLARELTPDIILLDIEMPEMDGFTLCKALQAIPALSGSTFMFITSHSDVTFETRALSLGAADFISKPINLDICRLRVKSQMTIKQQASSLHQAYSILHREKMHLSTILQSIGDAVIATDINEVITFINPVAQRLTGWCQKEAVGQKLTDVMVLRDASSGETMINPLIVALEQKRTVAMALNAEIVSKDGNCYRVEDSASPILDMEGNHIIGGVIVFQDVTDAIAMTTKMTHLTNHDQLTGLPNRILLYDRMLQAINNISHTDRMVTALLIDLDNFKYINDSLGHHVGDAIIQQVAKRLEGVCDPYTTVSRIGGDEFVVLLSDCSSMGYINTIASSVIETVNAPVAVDGDVHRLSISMGVSIYPTDARSPEEMLRHADTAMYKVKSEGKNHFSFFADELSEDLKERVNVEKMLHHSLDADALLVYFQPKYSLIDGHLTGMEALVRMKRCDGSIMTPYHFIPVAEESGLIIRLGKQVLDKSCKQAKAWFDAGKPVKVAVNIGASQFNEFGFTKTVADTLYKYDLSPEWLELEITESALIQNINSAKKAIMSLQRLGVSIALDDFGTGYSSLSYLRSFNFDVLKIDRSFILDIDSDEQAVRIVKAIIDLADSLRLEVVCEGIETQAQLVALQTMGCEQGQGFYFAKPQPAEALESAWEARY